MKLVRKFDVLTIQFNILFKAVHIPGIKKHCSRSSFSFADSEVQRGISIDGSTSNSELSGHSATLNQIQNVATNLIHGSLEKSSKESY